MRTFFLRIVFASLCCFALTGAYSQNAFVTMDFRNCGVGLKDSSGKWLCDPIFEKIEHMSPGFFRAILGSKEGVLRDDGKVIIPAAYDRVLVNWAKMDDSARPFFTLRRGWNWGLADDQHRFVLPMRYMDIDIYYDGTLVVQTGKKSYSLFNLNNRNFDGSLKEFPMKGRFTENPEYLQEHLFVVTKNRFGIGTRIKYRKKKGIFRKRYRSRGHFVFCLRQRSGLITDSGQKVLPVKYKHIYYAPEKYQLIYASKRKKFGYFRTDGSTVWPAVLRQDRYYPYRGYYDYYYYNERYPNINRVGYAPAKYKGKYGLIGAQGDTVLPFEYDYVAPVGRAWVAGCRWEVQKDNLEGIYDPDARRWIVPMTHSLYQVEDYKLPGDTVTAYVMLATNKQNKIGVITSEGQELLPCIYDDYTWINSDDYIFRSGENYFRIVFPRYMFDRAAVDSFPHGPLEKRELSDGTILFLNPELIGDTAQPSRYGAVTHKYYVSNPFNFGNLAHATVLAVMPLRAAVTLPGVGSVYTIPDVNLHIIRGSEAKLYQLSHTKDQIYPAEVIAGWSDSLYTYYKVGYSEGLYRSDGKTVLQPKSYRSLEYYGQRDGLSVFKVERSYDKTGLVDGNGRVLIDFLWEDIGTFNGNLVWVGEQQKFLSGKRWYYHWNIYDTTAHATLLPRKYCSNHRYALGDHGTVVNRPDGPRLYSTTTKQFVLYENVEDLMPLDSSNNFYAVRTCFGHIGIVDGSGKWLADTSWTTLLRGPTGREEDRLNHAYEGQYQFAVLSNDTGYLIFNGRAGTVTRNPATVHWLLGNAFVDYSDSAKAGAYRNDAPSIEMRDSLRSWTTLPAWQQDVLFDSLFMAEHFVEDTTHFYYTSQCDRCDKLNPRGRYAFYRWGKNYDRNRVHHFVEYSDDSCLSVGRVSYSSSSWNSHGSYDIFFTSMLFPGGPRAMLLDSFFVGTEWRMFMTNEVLNYLDAHLNVYGKCSNPYMLPFVMRNRFLVTEKGLLIFPPGYFEQAPHTTDQVIFSTRQLSILLTWEQLEPYLREDVKIKLGIR